MWDHLRIPVTCLNLPRKATESRALASSTTYWVGDLIRLLNYAEPQFSHLKDGNNGVVVKMKKSGRAGHIAVKLNLLPSLGH